MNFKNKIKSTWRVTLVELNTMFYSPVAWMILIIFSAQVGYTFASVMTGQMHELEIGWDVSGLTSKIFSDSNGGVFPPLLSTLYLYIPLITMGLMSREYQSGSIRLLYSSPISNASIIIGKFISMMVYGLALLSSLIILLIFGIFTIDNFDYPTVLVGLLGLYLLILAYSAIGLFMSSLTKYQVIAAIGTLIIFAVLNYMSSVGQSYDFIRDLTYWMAISGRVYPFIDGLIPTENVLYFLIVIGFFLSLSIFRLNTEKTIMSLKSKIIKCSLIIGVTLILGYIINIPETKFYYDATYSKINTLSPQSQEVLKLVKGPLKITTYCNLFADDFQEGLPQNRNNDRNRFENYIRFKKDIKMDYVLYYDIPYYSPNHAQFKEEKLKGMAEETCKVNDLDFSKFLSPEEFKSKYMDLKSEGNRFLRIFELKDGTKSILRSFNDPLRFPNEAEITTALRRLVSQSQKVAFSVGHGEREITNYGERGYYSFASNKWFRQSLLNQGFDTENIDLENDEIAEDINILVISDLKDSLSTIALNKVKKYIDNGGNLFLLGEYQRGANMNVIANYLGVEFMDGVLVNPSKYNPQEVVMAEYTKTAAEKFFDYTLLQKYEYKVSMPTCLALDYSKVKDFDVIPILQTNKHAWIEKETTDFVDGMLEYNESADEKMGVYTTLINLSRKVGNHEQRIIVSGDADFISNGELSPHYLNVESQNFGMITGSFRWLSNGLYPIDDRRADAIDNTFKIGYSMRSTINWLFIFILPFVITCVGGILIYRRRIK